jgi:CDP-diacylglycerol--serine O-phosphatidyltransferase
MRAGSMPCWPLWWPAIIDGLDGRIARLLKAVSRFGAEFDSLSDFCCFGIAPPLILYLWSLQGCRALRLHAVPDVLGLHGAAPGALQRGAGKRAQAGLRAKLLHRRAGAGRRRAGAVPAVPRLEASETGWTRVLAFAQHPGFVAALLVGCSMLLVSTLPVWSFKNFKVPAEYVLPLLLGTGLMAALLLADPWAGLAAAGAAYLAMLPFSLRSFRRLRAEAEEP